MAHSSRGWSGARTPQALKRVRQSNRRNAILQPRRSAAKTEVKDALQAAIAGDAEATRLAVAQASAALDRAAKVGAIHPNNAARRKSRLMLRVNAVLGGEALTSVAKPQRQVSKSAAAKAAKVRIAAGKASKAKGEQTAAGKARAALTKSSRSTDSAAKASAGAATTKATATKASASKPAAAKSTTDQGSGSKSTTAKTSEAKASSAKPAAAKSSTTKAQPRPSRARARRPAPRRARARPSPDRGPSPSRRARRGGPRDIGDRRRFVLAGGRG